MELPVRSLAPSSLYRVSRYETGEPFFGLNPDGRFSSADGSYGSCYLGSTLTVAVAETLLHDQVPQHGKYALPASEFARHVWRFEGPDLNLANLTGKHLKRLGGHGELSTTGDYAISQEWASAVHRHSQNVDGILYVSRHINTAYAVVLFDRAKVKLASGTHQELLRHQAFNRVAAGLGIKVAMY